MNVGSYNRPDRKQFGLSSMTDPSDFLIYVVVHEDAVRDSTCVLLDTIRFRVRGFKSADAFLRADRPIISCVIIDDDNPGMSGSELLERLRSEGFSVPTVIMTTGKWNMQAAISSVGAIFLEKPFVPEKLIGCIAKALAH